MILSAAQLSLRVAACATIPLTYGDAVTTNGALTRPGVTEGNPIERAAMWALKSRWVIFRCAFNEASLYVAFRSDGHWAAVASLGLGVLATAYAVWSNGRIWGKW